MMRRKRNHPLKIASDYVPYSGNCPLYDPSIGLVHQSQGEPVMYKISRGKQHRLIEAARELGLNAKFFVTIQQRYPSRFEYISNKHENLVTAYTFYLLEVEKTRTAMLEFIEKNQGSLEYLSQKNGKTKTYFSSVKSTLIKGREISHSQFMTYKEILEENQ